VPRPILFVVGNSRSGTTLVGRLLGRHPDVFRFRESHFFDRFWSRDSPTRRMSQKEATIVAAGLCRRQARDVTACRAEAAALVVASVREADRRAGQARTHSVRFEDLLHDPATVVARIYAFCDMDFERRVLDVPQVGSSNVPNRAGALGIDPTRSGRWREGGLDRAEIYLCELIAGPRMRRHGYEPSGVQPDLPRLWLHLFTMSIRTGSALALHAARMDDVIGALRRRVGIS